MGRPAELDERLILPERYGEGGAPVDVWAWLRANDPVHRTEVDGLEPFWAVTTHEHVAEVSGQPEVFSNNASGVLVGKPPKPFARRALTKARKVTRKVTRSEVGGAAFAPILEMDPPDHRVFRQVMAPWFTPRAIGRLAEVTDRAAGRTIDGVSGQDVTDVVGELAQRHSMLVLGNLMGLEDDQIDLVLHLTHEYYRSLGDSSVDGPALMENWTSLIRSVIADRRRAPRDDLATHLAHADIEGRAIPDPVLMGYFLIVFTAGHDTTRHALSGAVAAFAEFGDEYARLRDDDSLLSTAVEEIVRWTAPVNYMKRTALDDYELGGRQIRAGDRLALFYGSATRDEAVFREPDRFDVGRSPNRHLGFGWAEHYCLGAHLARSSLASVVRQLAERVETIEAAGPATFERTNFVVGHQTLPVRFGWR